TFATSPTLRPTSSAAAFEIAASTTTGAGGGPSTGTPSSRTASGCPSETGQRPSTSRVWSVKPSTYDSSNRVSYLGGREIGIRALVIRIDSLPTSLMIEGAIP